MGGLWVKLYCDMGDTGKNVCFFVFLRLCWDFGGGHF